MYILGKRISLNVQQYKQMISLQVLCAMHLHTHILWRIIFWVILNTCMTMTAPEDKRRKRKKKTEKKKYMFSRQVSWDSSFTQFNPHNASDPRGACCFCPLRHPGVRPAENWSSAPPKPGMTVTYRSSVCTDHLNACNGYMLYKQIYTRNIKYM